MRRSLVSLVALSSLLACGEPPADKPVDTGVETPGDADGDGLTADFDCDDANVDVHVYAVEVCDGVDNDCDGLVDDADDDAVLDAWYVDADQDGAGDADTLSRACAAPEGAVAEAGDCDDANADLYPGAAEVCDGLDNDCDGDIDDDAEDAAIWYLDADGDGHGTDRYALVACEAVAGWVAEADDCDDLRAEAAPGMPELCNALDDDCDGLADEEAIDAATWYADFDGDGFGDPDAAAVSCTAPSAHVAVAGDCDDGSAAIAPDQDEACNGIDDDCDGVTDDPAAADTATWYVDAAGDGFGGDSAVTACAPPAGTVAVSGDCDDAATHRYPGAVEVCDAADDDCDGLVDDSASDAPTWYIDYDSDGFGAVAYTLASCDAPTGYVAAATDCNDAASGARPGGVEVCDGLDNDCDGATDGADATDAARWYGDADGDGFGTATTTANACTVPSGYVALATDCNDGSSAVRPDASETCNGVDDDCDGSTDESSAVDATVWYLDADADGYGTSSTTVTACAAPSGYRSASGDCNDASASVRPGAAEDCDGLDNDCDGSTDEDGRYGDIARCAADSCVDVLRTRTDSPSDGVYWIDPAGAGAYQAYCDMSRRGGGWTLLAVFSNADGSARWSPDSANWVDTGTFGAPTSASTTSDAKSQAWNDLSVDEVMIADASSSVYVQSSPSCVGSNTLRWLFRRDSSNSANCAWSCGTATVSSPWNQSQTDSTLRFRCMDTNGGTTTANGFVMSNDDNSMITTLQNGSYIDYNFGLGAGYVGSFADYDASTDDYGNPSVTTPMLLLGR
jgi:hypothetical protein